MKKFLFFAIFSIISTLVAAQEMNCSFTQDRTIKASGKVFHSEGVISFTAPDQLTMTFTDPEGEYFIISGPMLRSNTQGKNISVNTDKSAIFRSLRNTLIYCITGEYEKAAQENDAELTVSEKNGIKYVSMKARKTLPRGYSGVEMEYNKKGLPVRMVLEEFVGITTEYHFKY